MTFAILNPGTGAVAGACYRHARENIDAFLADLGLDNIQVERVDEADESDGRFTFILRRGHKKIDMEMPGIETVRVRYMDAPGQNIWRFPRLYVDGSSYVWFFALETVRDALEES